MIISWLNRGGLIRCVRRGWLLLVALGFLFSCIAYASGCGASGLQLQARSATVTASTLTVAQGAIAAGREAAFDRVEAAYPTDPEHDAQLDLEASRWRPVEAAMDGARSALLLWIDGIDLARIADGDDFDVTALLPLAARVVLTYGQVAELAESVGLDLPELPAMVTSLAESIGGE